MRVVVSQSMLFPWVGLLEQVSLADTFVHYDDVQFSKGSFVNRVQVKTPTGIRWMTIPLSDVHLGQTINQVQVKSSSQWRGLHLDLLSESFAGARYASDALEIADAVYSEIHQNLGSLARASLLALAGYFELDLATRFVDVGDLKIAGAKTDRVLQVVKKLGGDQYITGHGAAKYLDHDAFESEGISVEYMDYRCRSYPQPYGEFTPYVTGLDLVARCGRAGIGYISSGTKHWRNFLNGTA